MEGLGTFSASQSQQLRASPGHLPRAPCDQPVRVCVCQCLCGVGVSQGVHACVCPSVRTAGVYAHTYVNLRVYSCVCVCCVDAFRADLAESPEDPLMKFHPVTCSPLGQCGVQAPCLGQLSVPPSPSASAAPLLTPGQLQAGQSGSFRNPPTGSFSHNRYFP